MLKFGTIGFLTRLLLLTSLFVTPAQAQESMSGVVTEQDLQNQMMDSPPDYGQNAMPAQPPLGYGPDGQPLQSPDSYNAPPPMSPGMQALQSIYAPYNPQTGQYAPSYGPPPGWSYQPMGRMLPHYQESVATGGLTIPIVLDTSISTQAAKPGDYIQAHVGQNISLSGAGYIPSGTVVTGSVTASKPGRWAERSGLLTISFDQMRLPNGISIPISAHLVGDIGKYKNNNDTVRGEGMGTKLMNLGIRGGLGAGLGAALGTAVGGIAGGGYGCGRGAWSGAAIGGGIGALDSLVLRRGRDVIIHGGTPMQLQLDDAVSIPGSPSTPAYSQAAPSTGVF